MQTCAGELFSDSRVKIQNYIFRVHFNEEVNLLNIFMRGHCQGREALGNILLVEGKPLKLKGYQKSLRKLNVEEVVCKQGRKVVPDIASSM